MPTHKDYMLHALALARRGLGTTAPNPTVGALLVRNGRIIGRGWTSHKGRPHAETNALAQAAETAHGATLYVTLEPCSHSGKTPPCTDAIIQAGIARVVIACTDPNPQVNGKGIDQLKAAGIEVVYGVCEEEARALNAGFFNVITGGMPLLSLKLATSLDGMMATAGGDSKWITSAAARAFGHMLRAEHDAVLTGIGTVLADNPQLTCRIAGITQQPARVIMDSRLRLPVSSALIATIAQSPVIIFTEATALDSRTAEALRNAGATLYACAHTADGLDMNDALAQLGRLGFTRILAESGGHLTGSLLAQNLPDILYWFRGNCAIGNAGIHGTQGNFPAILSTLPRYTHQQQRRFENDTLDIYRK